MVRNQNLQLKIHDAFVHKIQYENKIYPYQLYNNNLYRYHNLEIFPINAWYIAFMLVPVAPISDYQILYYLNHQIYNDKFDYYVNMTLQIIISNLY